MKKTNLMVNTAIMTVANLIMRSVSVAFNAYITEKIGASGIGLFQLIMSVYSMAVTFSCAGIRLATTRISVETTSLRKNDTGKSLTLCVTYAGICGSIIGFIIFSFSNKISLNWIHDSQTAFPLKILSLSLPFVAMSSSLGGYFTAINCIPQYSCIQIAEQGFKTMLIIFLIERTRMSGPAHSCMIIVIGMTVSEIFSFILSFIFKSVKCRNNDSKNSIGIKKIIRIAVPDAIGTCARSVLLTIEHLMIPECFKKSGKDSSSSLAVYGRIHAMSMPVILFPSAVLSSLSSLLIPNIAKMNESGDETGIKKCIERNLRRTIKYSVFISVFFFLFSSPISFMIYKTNEAAKYIKILSPLIPIMYTDMVTDGMLKGLDLQIYSMRYNIIDSALCVCLIPLLLPVYSVNGYIFILYISEIMNFILSINRLKTVCGFKVRYFQAHGAGSSRFSRLKKC